MILELVEEGAELLRAEATRDGGPRGEGAHADVDDEICALLVERLHAAFPDDTIRSEELPEVRGGSGRAWVVDPHDGTSHFLRGSRDTSISIGYVEGGRLRLGVVFAPLASPLTGEGLLVSWAEGDTLRRNGEEWSPGVGPEQFEDGPGGPILVTPRLRTPRHELVAPHRLVGCGSFATRLALVATGEAVGGLTVHNQLSDWDYAGGQALLRARGGALVGLEGQRVEWEGCRPRQTGLRFFFAGPSLGWTRALAARYRARFGA